MRVITLANQKGGPGKSTTLLGFVGAALDDKKSVLILDMDPQGTVSSWYELREDETPIAISIEAGQVDEAIEHAKRQDYDWVFIDTAGRDAPSINAAIRVADFCVIPCRPTPQDMKAVPPTWEIIKRLNKPAATVLNQTQPRGYRIREAMKGLEVLGLVAPIHIVTRNTYQDAFGAGLTLSEFEPDGKARAEFKALWKWVTKKIDKVVN